MKTIVTLCLALGFAVPVQAQQAAPPAEARSVDPTALRIAQRLAGADMVLGQTRRVLKQQMPTAMAGDPKVQELEARWPGISGEMIATMEPIILASIARRLPTYQRSIADVFAAQMNATELAATDAFYGSPAGQHALAAIRDGADYGALLKRQLSAPKTPLSGTDITSAIAPAVQPALNQLTPQEQLQLMSFSMTSAGRKMTGISGSLGEAAARFGAEKDPETQAAIKAAVVALVQRKLAVGTGKPK